LRIEPPSNAIWTREITVCADHDAPPSVDMNEPMNAAPVVGLKPS
jgi:hypothetical protein